MNNTELSNTKNDIIEFVSAIITNKDGNPLVIKRLDTLKLDPGKYDMCSGHMKKRECPMQSMYRELMEEVGIEHYDIQKMEHLGDIPTPHPKFPNTVTHIYHVLIDLELEEINRRIEKTQDREMDFALYLENVDALRRMQKETKTIRIEYTEETEKIYQLLEKKLKDRKELEESKCEEK